MDEQGKTVIIETQIVDNFVESAKNAAYWREQLRDAQKQGDAYKGNVNEVARELAKANNRFREAKKVIESSERAEQLLGQATDNTVKTLGEMQRELSALRSVPLDAFPEEQAAQLKQRMADLLATIADTKAEIKGMDTGAVWENMASSLQFVTSGAQLLGQGLQALGVESEWAEKLQDSTLELIGATQALATITDLLGQKKLKQLAINLKTIASNLTQSVTLKALSVQTKGAALAENLLTSAKTKGVVASKAATAAAWLLNAALAANPIVLIVAAVAALAAGVWGLTKAFGGSASAAKAAEKSNADYEKSCKKNDAVLQAATVNQNKRLEEQRIANRKRMAELKRSGATEEQLAKASAENASKIREIEVAGAEERIGNNKKLLDQAKKNLTLQERQLNSLRAGSKRYKEQADKVLDLKNAYNDLVATINEDVFEVQHKLQDQADAELEEQKRVADATFERLQKTLDRKRQVAEAALKAQAGFQSQDFAQRQRYAQRLRELSDRSELERLTLARRYGKMTQAEYEAGLAVLNDSMQEFRNAQAREANDYYRQQREAIFSLFDKTAQEQIDGVNEKYRKAYEQLNQQAMHAPDASAYEGGTDNKEYQRAQRAYEDFMYNLASIRARMEEQQQEEIASIEENSLRRRAEKIERQIERLYDGDLRKWQDNERKKLEVTIAQLEAQAAAKQAKGLDTYDEDAALAVARRQINQMNLDSELLAAGENARAKYKVRKAYLEEEMKLAEGNADRQGEIQAQSLENEREYFTARIDAVGKWSDAAMQAMGAVNDLFNALGEAKLQKAQENYDRESEMLQEQLDQGYISQAEYDRKQQQLDKNLEREQKKIARQQAVREKEMALFKIAVDTAMAIMALWVTPGFPVAIPMAAMVGALGAVQLAAVAAQPLPKAARGRYISGRSHAQGGELVVAEDGEIIMNRNSVRMFGPELSAMSVAGGGVPFHIPDGGYTARYAMSRGLSKADIEDAMTRAVKRVKVYTVVEDIRRSEQNYAQVQTRGQV